MTYSTVRAVTSPELTYLRTPGQQSKLFLAIFKPSTVYTATLAAVPSSLDSVTAVTFSGGTGTLANVLPDMTLYVGSTAGAYDLGVARIRKAPIAGTFYIGEESDIKWNNGGTVYLTVVNEFDIWAKHIRTVNDTTFYMDWDVTYTDQNATFSPIPIMGGHRVLKLTGANVSTQFDWSNSYCIGSSVTGYSVSCSTATITGGTTATPTLQFTAAGWHMVVLTVTAANGKTNVGVRYVYIYSDANPPATVFQLGSCSEDYETGGWNFEVTMQAQAGLTDVPERTLCILFAEDYYGDTQVSIGQLTGCENIICIGKISDEMYDINPELGEVTLSVSGMQSWMQKIYAFPTGVTLTTATPTDWTQMQSPTVDKVLYRLLQWGSTIIKMMDVYLTNDTKIATELISPASNLWAQIQELAFATLMAKAGVDRFGRMFIEVEPQVVPVASRTWPTVMTLTSADWQDSVRLQRAVVNSAGQVSSSGVTVVSSGTGNALFSLSPGHVFTRYGNPEVLDRLLLSTQGLSNQLAGLVLGWRNNPFPNSDFHMSGNNRMIDCFPRQKVQWSVSSTDTPRMFTFTDAKFIPRRVSYKWDENSGFLDVEVSLEMEGVEVPNVNGDIPGNGDVDVSNPPKPPPFPDFPTDPILIGGDIPTTHKVVLLLSSNYGILKTSNFDDENPHWELWNTGLGSIPNGTPRGTMVVQLHVASTGAVYAVRLISISGANWNAGTQEFFIYYSPSIGGTFVPIVNRDILDALYGAPGYFNAYGLLDFGLSKAPGGSVMYATLGPGDGVQVYYGSALSYATGVLTSLTALGTGGGDQAGLNFSYGNNKWTFQKSGGYYELNTVGQFINGGHSVPQMNTPIFNREMLSITRGGTGPVVYCANDGDWAGGTLPRRNILGSLDNFATYYDIRSTTYNPRYNGLACDPTGRYLMTQGETAFTTVKSTDYGNTWSPVPSLPPGTWEFLNMGDGNKWIAAGSTAVRWTDDGGSTWWNKEGNITADFPVTGIFKPAWGGG